MRSKVTVNGIDCPLERTIRVIGDRWSALILRDLFVKGSCRFQDFAESLNEISPTVLSSRIKKLLEYEVIVSRQYSKHPPRNVYELTEKGKELGPILAGLRDWGSKYTRV